MTSKLYILCTFFCLIIICSGCKDTVTGEDIDNRPMPTKNVSFSNDILPVLDVKCNTSGCHEDATRAGGVSLTSYQNVTADFDIVFPGEPDNSRLVIVIKPGSSNPMPPAGYPGITEKQLNGIITWIREGAKNN